MERSKVGETTHLTVEVNDIDHILVPPEKDMFSTNPCEYMGQSALQRCKAMVKEERGFDKRQYHFTFLVPPDQLGRRSETEVRSAIDRYVDTLHKDNDVQLQVIRHRGYRMIPYALVILFICITGGVIFGSDRFLEISPLFFAAVSEGLYIIGWVSLWGPTDTLLFEPMELRTENRLLRLIKKVDIEIRASG
jgi:hypothetical protein